MVVVAVSIWLLGRVPLSWNFVFLVGWFLQAGLCLYTDVFSFNGCRKILISPESENAELKCDLEEDGSRGVALVNL